MKKVKWISNIAISMLIAIALAALNWLVEGEAAGKNMFLLWLALAYIFSCIFDLIVKDAP